MSGTKGSVKQLLRDVGLRAEKKSGQGYNIVLSDGTVIGKIRREVKRQAKYWKLYGMFPDGTKFSYTGDTAKSATQQFIENNEYYIKDLTQTNETVSFKQFLINEDLGNPQKVYVGKNMDEKEAKNKAMKKATRDFRGVKYNKNTGYVTLT